MTYARVSDVWKVMLQRSEKIRTAPKLISYLCPTIVTKTAEVNVKVEQKLLARPYRMVRSSIRAYRSWSQQCGRRKDPSHTCNGRHRSLGQWSLMRRPVLSEKNKKEYNLAKMTRKILNYTSISQYCSNQASMSARYLQFNHKYTYYCNKGCRRRYYRNLERPQVPAEQLCSWHRWCNSWTGCRSSSQTLLTGGKEEIIPNQNRMICTET